MTNDPVFHEYEHKIGIALIAQRLLYDYSIAENLPGVGPEGYAEAWIATYVYGPQNFKDEILETFVNLLIKSKVQE